MSSDERTVSTNATSTNPNPPPPRTRHPSQVHNKATFYQYRSERFNEMQTCIEDIVANRVHIVDDLCKKSLEGFLAQAEDKAETLTYEVLENHTSRVVGRVRELMEQHMT